MVFGINGIEDPNPELTTLVYLRVENLLGRNPDNDWSGRPFVFSNRGEVEKLKSLS